MRGFVNATLLMGVAFAVVGLWWIARNSGLVGADLMMGEMQWFYRGLALVVFGAGLAVWSRRI